MNLVNLVSITNNMWSSDAGWHVGMYSGTLNMGKKVKVVFTNQGWPKHTSTCHSPGSPTDIQLCKQES
jgi:hypothetical protein